MKQITLLLLCLLVMNSTGAVDYEYAPLVREGKIWVDCQRNTSNHVEYLTYYQFYGTTTINGVVYSNLYASVNTRAISDDDVPMAFVREADKRVYVILNGQFYGKDYQWGVDGDFVPMYGCQLVDSTIGEFLVYDFNDILAPYSSLGSMVYKKMKETLTSSLIQIDNHLATCFSFMCYFAPPGSTYYSIAEGIGSLSKAFIKIWETNNNMSGLAWVEDEGTIIFKGHLYDAAVDFVSYAHLVREGVKWVEYTKASKDNPEYVTYYQFSGEKHIGDHDYSQLFATRSDTISQEDTPVAYAREENRQVFIIPVDVEVNGCKLVDESINEYQIYDFNDITAPYVVADHLLQPVSKEQVVMNNKLVNFYTLGGTKQIVEGLGCLDHVFYNPWAITQPEGEHRELAWVESGGEIIYKNECYDEAETASGYVRLAREGVVWEYVGYMNHIGTATSNEHLYTLSFNGTESIDNEDGTASVYHKLCRTDYGENGEMTGEKTVALVKEEAKCVTTIAVFDYWWSPPDTVYCFTRPMFLPTTAANYLPQSDLNNAVQFEVKVGETMRKGYSMEGYHAAKIIEGIGVDCEYGDLLIPYRYFYTGIGNPMAGLSAVYENGELVYKGCLYEEAQRLKDSSAITTVAGDRQAQSVRYYNLAGVESGEPQPGISIKMTTWSDGTRTSEKVVR